jgi:uncharacterized delta-60 repeat protein
MPIRPYHLMKEGPGILSRSPRRPVISLANRDRKHEVGQPRGRLRNAPPPPQRSRGSIALCLLLLAFSPNGRLRAGPGALDTGFLPAEKVEGFAVDCTTLQPDGRILIGGDFYFWGEQQQFYDLARLYPDGRLDGSFLPKIDGYEVFSLVLQPDGRVLIGGDFTGVNGLACGNLARLMPDGTSDTNFVSSPGVKGVVQAMLVQPDGKILIGGDFTNVQGVARSGIARLESNGGLDPSFDPGAGIGDQDSVLYALALQRDGKVLIAGDFTSVNGAPRSMITRLNSDGNLDNTFDPGLKVMGGFAWVRSIVLQPDGKILIGGAFQLINSFATPRFRIARLNADGTLDTTFVPPFVQKAAYLADGWVGAVALQPDGKVLIGGWFGALAQDITQLTVWNRSCVARLNANGSFDPTFDPGTGIEPSDYPDRRGIASIVLQPEGKALLGGHFNTFDGRSRQNLLRVQGDPPDRYPPTITLQPAGQSALPGTNVSLNVVATGTAPVNLQWLKDGVPLHGQTNWAVNLKGVQAAAGGGYQVVLSNAIGSATSTVAQLVITVPEPIHLVGLALTNGFAVHFAAEVGRRYEIETSTNLPNWSPWTNVIGGGTNLRILDEGALRSPQRFYRGSSGR